MHIERKAGFTVAVALYVASSFAVWADQSASFGWDPSLSSGVAGYAVYYGNASSVYDSRLDVGLSTTATVGGLASGQTYYFATVAYDADADESIPSNEVVYEVPGAISVDELTTLTLTNSAASLGLPPGPVVFSLSNAPAGASIDMLTGVFTWTPSEAQGPSTNIFGVIVTTNGLPDLTDSQTITVIVNEINLPPVLPSQPDRTVAGMATVMVTNTATDPDLPANSLTYQLINPPAGAVIDTNGVITWTPTAGQIPSTNVIQTVVTDYSPWAVNAQHLSATNSFAMIVLQTNGAPPLPPGQGGPVVLTTLVCFAGTNGANPSAGLVQGADGSLYGTTTSGGTYGCGTVFRMTSSGALTPLVSLNVGNGAYPFAGLVQNASGCFYGTTVAGGSHSVGTAFSMTPNGMLTNLHSFDSRGGLPYAPFAGLLQPNGGSMYGTTALGGANGQGAVFKLTMNGAFTTLFSFSGTNGSNPSAGLMQGQDASFYGTTEGGGEYTDPSGSGYGTLFKLTTNGTVTTLVSFHGTNGATPAAGLVLATDGSLYGTTQHGGSYGYGTVFKLTTNGTLITLSFNGTNGAAPAAGLIQGSDGRFYGTTANGGAYTNQSGGGYGTVFMLALDGTLTTLVSFNGTNGAYPQAGLLQAADGNFYGTTANGGCADSGTIFRLSFAGPSFQTVTQTGGMLTLTWSATTGQMYQMQYKTDLNQTNWNNLGTAVTATNGLATASDVIGSKPQRFYRVVLVQ